MGRPTILAALLIVIASMLPPAWRVAPLLAAASAPPPVISAALTAAQEQPAGNAGEDKLTRVVLWYIFKTLGVVVGGIAIYLGYRLFILGVTGKASLKVQASSVGGQLLNAAPGLFFAVGGLALCAWAIWAK